MTSFFFFGLQEGLLIDLLSAPPMRLSILIAEVPILGGQPFCKALIWSHSTEWLLLISASYEKFLISTLTNGHGPQSPLCKIPAFAPTFVTTDDALAVANW